MLRDLIGLDVLKSQWAITHRIGRMGCTTVTATCCDLMREIEVESGFSLENLER